MTNAQEFIFTSSELKELHKLCRLRSTLEVYAIAQHRREGNGKPGPELNAEIKKCMKQLYRQAVRGEYRTFHKTDRELHYSLVASCGILSLTKSWEIVFGDLDKWLLHVKRTYWPSLMSLYNEHSLLVDAWRSPDNWIAEQATHEHLEAGWYRVAANQEHPLPEVDPVNRTVSFLSTHFASDLNVEWIARNVSFVSPSHLTRLFRNTLGVSPKAYLKQVRMERAAEILLKSNEKIHTVAERVGYKNTSHFIRDFHKNFGITPLAYHKKKSGSW